MRPEKAWMMQNLKAVTQSNSVIVMTDFTGISAIALGNLRNRLREVSGTYFVVKGSILNRAMSEASGVDISSANLGPTGIAFGVDPVSVAKVLKAFAGENEAFKIKSGIMNNRLIDAKQIAEMAKIPAKPVLIGQFVGTLKKPLVDLVYVLKANLSGLTNVLARIKEAKEKAETNPA